MIDGLTFDAEKHEYRLHGVLIPGVTSIITEVGGACGIAPTYPVGNYRVRGSRVHEACALYDKGILDQYEIGEAIQPYVEGWKKACVDFPIKWIGIEEQIYDPTLCVGGTTDGWGFWMEKLVVADRKSGATGRETGLQLAAYTLMLKRLGRFPVGTMFEDVVRIKFELSPDGTYKAHRYENEYDFEAWEGLVRLYNWKRMRN
jgi:hypothetical protein